MVKLYTLLLLSILAITGHAQQVVSGKVLNQNQEVPYANVYIKGTHIGTSTDAEGNYSLKIPQKGSYKISASAIGYKTATQSIDISASHTHVNFNLSEAEDMLDEVVVSGTLNEVSKLESPVPVEVFSKDFFKANPSPSLFEAIQNINGVRPQINCNVCNTGDIHINGLEGPYTMILIDGMPIVSGLATVYGLSGIPQSLIERVEVVKGPASTLYGSEAVGGLINVITKNVDNASHFSTDIYTTSWQEVNADIATKIKVAPKLNTLVGINYFNYSNPVDHNNDNFTDVTLENRISVFNKWQIKRASNKEFQVGGRYIYEDRWGGEMNWSSENRGGNDVYGESIYTKRWELMGTYELPTNENLKITFSANRHLQNSAYGDMLFNADQQIYFGQLTWIRTLNNHNLLAGAATRYTYYDDNTTATEENDSNAPSKIYLPGLFIQDEYKIDKNQSLLLGMRYDYNSIHGNILTPRLNYKWTSNNKNNVIRLSTGRGYRVANVFTEDHAALTGARDVEFIDNLKPETSWNANLNYVRKIYTVNGTYIQLDATAFYTYFGNKIIADYDSDPNKIIYDNLDGHAISQGASVDIDTYFSNGLKVMLGATLMDVYRKENGETIQQLFTEHFTGTWRLGYEIPNTSITLDYTGNVYSPMRLPLLGTLDPRDEYSPWWSIQNIQITKKWNKNLELYGGVKNLLNWTPNKGNPFIIARSNDPFDKQVDFDQNGQVIATPNNPYSLTFDPTYVYGPNQGIRGFIGLRYAID